MIVTSRVQRIANKLSRKEKILNRLMMLSSDIVNLMNKNNINVSDVAKALNVTETTVKKYMSGTYNFNLKTISKLEEYFDTQFIFTISEKNI